MKTVILASLVFASTLLAHASDVTVLMTNLPATRGATTVETKFHVDTDMKEVFAEINAYEQVTTYVEHCSGGYNRPGFPRRTCHTVPQIRYQNIFTDQVKIKDMAMNDDDVIYQGPQGDVVCGTMGRSRVFRIPTFYLSGKCDLAGTIVNENGINKLSVKFITE